jgi:hypothetical protein
MSDAQKRVPHGRRRLRRIDRELRRSDPELASMLSIFSRLNAGEMMPGWEQVRTPPVLDWHLPLWPLASLAFLVVFAAGGGSDAASRAAVACGARRPRGRAPASGPAAASGLARGCCGSPGCGRIRGAWQLPTTLEFLMATHSGKQ